MENFATAYPVIFSDGEQEHDKGHIGIHSALTFKRFQTLMSQKMGVPPNQLSAVFVYKKTSSEAEKRQKLPINENTNFSIILNQHNPSREKGCYFLVSLKKSKKERKISKKRNAEGFNCEGFNCGDDHEGPKSPVSPMNFSSPSPSTGSEATGEMPSANGKDENGTSEETSFPRPDTPIPPQPELAPETPVSSLGNQSENHSSEELSASPAKKFSLKAEILSEAQYRHKFSYSPETLPFQYPEFLEQERYSNFIHQMPSPKLHYNPARNNISSLLYMAPLKSATHLSSFPSSASSSESSSYIRRVSGSPLPSAGFYTPRNPIQNGAIFATRDLSLQQIQRPNTVQFQQRGSPAAAQPYYLFGDNGSCNWLRGPAEIQLETQNAVCQVCYDCKMRHINPIPFHRCVEDRIVLGFRGPSPAGPIERPGKRSCSTSFVTKF